MKLIGLYVFIFTSIVLHGQDTIYTRYGEIINAKVLEIGVDQVKYKKTNNPDGPSYALLKSDVTLIQYLNGTKDLFPVAEYNNDQPSNPSTGPREEDEDLSDALRIVANVLPFFTYTNWAWGWGWNSSWNYNRPLFSGRHHHHHSHHNHSGHYGRRR